MPPCNTIVENPTAGIAYAGLQLNKGRIIVIENEVTPKMIIREDYILGHTSNVDLNMITHNPAFQGDEVMNRFWGDFKINVRQVSAKPDVIPVNSNSNTPLATQYTQGSKRQRELVFIQSKANLIEKVLGVSEKMRIRRECLVAISPTVHVTRDQNRMVHEFMLTEKSKFLMLTGPGTVYVEMRVGKKFHFKERSQIMLFLVYIMVYLVALLLMFFDERIR